jgi:competence protein ComEA
VNILTRLVVVVFIVLFAADARTTERRHASETERPADLVDINRATADELKTLPGIQDAWAASIARNRPYQNKAQLLSRKVIPAATYKNIKRRIIARQ